MSAKSAKKVRWLRRRDKSTTEQLPSVWALVGGAYKTLIDNWKIFGVITLIYAALFILLVRAETSINVNETRELVQSLIGQETSGAEQTLAVAGVVLSSAASGGDASNNLYGLFLIIIFSLVQIWVLRRLAAGKKFKLRDAFYRSQTALIPFILILLLMLIQLLPFALGGMLYATVEANNIAVHAWETTLFAVLWAGLAVVSGWWVSNSLMSVYAVTLPGLYPVAALKATGKAIKHRRFEVFRKVIFLAAVVGAVFFVALMFTATVAASLNLWLIDLFAVAILPFIHAYLYQLYRSLI